MILYFYDGDIYCRACIREDDPRARFEDDNPDDWEYGPDGEPVGTLYYQSEGSECHAGLEGGCMSDVKNLKVINTKLDKLMELVELLRHEVYHAK